MLLYCVGYGSHYHLALFLSLEISDVTNDIKTIITHRHALLLNNWKSFIFFGDTYLFTMNLNLWQTFPNMFKYFHALCYPMNLDMFSWLCHVIKGLTFLHVITFQVNGVACYVSILKKQTLKKYFHHDKLDSIYLVLKSNDYKEVFSMN